jgi:hypothetical protein
MKQVSKSSYVPEVRRFDDSARCRISDITATTGGTIKYQTLMPMQSLHVRSWGLNGLGWHAAQSLKRTRNGHHRPQEGTRFSSKAHFNSQMAAT